MKEMLALRLAPPMGAAEESMEVDCDADDVLPDHVMRHDLSTPPNEPEDETMLELPCSAAAQPPRRKPSGQTLADELPLTNTAAIRVPYFPPKHKDFNHKNRPAIKPLDNGSFLREGTEVSTKWCRIMGLDTQLFDRLFIPDQSKLQY